VDDPIDILFARLQDVATADEFSDLLDRHPAFLGDDVLRVLVDMQRIAAYAGLIRPVERLIREARDDPAEAWTRFQRAREESAKRMEDVEQAVAQVDELVEKRRWREALDLAERTLRVVRAEGMGLVEAMLRRQAGVAALHLAAMEPELVEVATEHLQGALAPLPPPEAADAVARALGTDALINLSVAYASNPGLDPEAALEAAIDALTQALTFVDRRHEPEKWATAHTNLSRAFRRRERGDRRDNLTRSLHHAEEVLAERSPERDAGAWVYSQMNYGDALSALAAEDAGYASRADAAFTRIIEEGKQIPEPWIVAGAHRAIASRLLRRANELREDDARAAAEAARTARPHIHAALGLTADDAPRIERGRALVDAASFEAGWGDANRAVELYDSALSRLHPASPADARDAGRALGDLHADAGRWPEAAAAYRLAVQAAHLAVHARLYESGRELEKAKMLNLARFAAFALARADAPVDAALVLEDLRALEFRRRTPVGSADLELLRAAAPDLFDAYQAHLAELRASPLTGVPDEVSANLESTLAEIRRLPGLGHFAARARLEDFDAAIDDGFPLVFVDPSPHGTLLLILSRKGDQLGTRTVFLPVASDEIFHRLAFGKYEELLAGVPAEQLPASYLGTAAGLIAGRDVEDALDYVLDWLGEHLAEAIHEQLEAIDARGATLVPCGPVAAAPIHVARWASSSGTTCLIDRYVIRFAPSAIVQAAASYAAGTRSEPRKKLVAVANPGLDLPASEAEVGEIAAHFQEAAVATRRAATRRFVSVEAPAASALHLACHARADIAELSKSVIGLSDGPVALSDLPDFGQLGVRIVVASACQTAFPNLERGDESMSVATALLMTGTPCAVASLWSVHDFPTALLMVRFYEVFLASPDVGPAASLRDAHLWLRELTEETLRTYLARHPRLDAVFKDLEAQGALPGLFDHDPATRPFADEVYWAALSRMEPDSGVRLTQGTR
jgi:hypothetical protein